MTDIRYDLRDYRDLYAKLRRDVVRFKEEPSGDHLFNAMVTAWCLADWLLAHLTPTDAMWPGLTALSGKTPGQAGRDSSVLHPAMQICRDIAEASKHGKLNRPALAVTDVRATDGTYGSAIYGFSRYGDTGRRYAVVADGVMHDAKDILSEVLDLYDRFLTDHGLLDDSP